MIMIKITNNYKLTKRISILLLIFAFILQFKKGFCQDDPYVCSSYIHDKNLLMEHVYDFGRLSMIYGVKRVQGFIREHNLKTCEQFLIGHRNDTMAFEKSTYNKQGKIIKERSVGNNEEVNEIIYTYDTKGNLFKVIWIDIHNDTVFETYYYDPENRLKEHYLLNENKDTVAHYNYYYDALDRAVKITKKEEGELVVYEYLFSDTSVTVLKNKSVEMQFLIGDDRVIKEDKNSKFYYTYVDDDYIIKKQEVKKDSSGFISTHYYKDKLLKYYVSFIHAPDYGEKTIIELKYNPEGLIVERTMQSLEQGSSHPYTTTTRFQYTYW